MIKVDVDKMVFNLDGSTSRLLVELEYIVADLFVRMLFSDNIDKETAEDLINESKDYGINKAMTTILEVRGKHER